MLGQVIARLEDPAAASALMACLGDPDLAGRLSEAARAADLEEAELLALSVRGFVDSASDDLWTQLIGIMSRAEDPGLAALKAILRRALPPAAPPAASP
jgi:hypothetical protein